MSGKSIEQICLIDNATLNQCALALGRRFAFHEHPSESSPNEILQDDPAKVFDAAPEAFIASLASFVQCLVLYDRVFVLTHTNHMALWERYDLRDDIQRRVRSFSMSRVELDAARQLAVERLRYLTRTPGCVLEFTALLKKLRAIQLRKSSTMVPAKSDEDDFARGREAEWEIQDDLREIFQRLMRRVVGKKHKKRAGRRSPSVDESIAYSLYYWLYYRTLYYGAIATMFNGRSHGREVIHVPALVRSQHARLFLDHDADALNLVEKVVRNGEQRAIKQLRTEYPDLPLAQVNVPPIFAYVLDQTDDPSDILNVARDLKSSDANIRALREQLATLRASLVQGRDGIPALMKEIAEVSDEVQQRWSTKTSRLVERISFGYNGATPSISADFLTAKLKSLIGATRPRGVVSVLSSFRFAVNNVNSLGPLYDKHFWQPVADADSPDAWRSHWMPFDQASKSPRAARKAERRMQQHWKSRDRLESEARRERLMLRNSEMAKEFDKQGPVGVPVNRPKGKDAPWHPHNKRLVDPMAAAMAAIKASWSS